MTARALAIVALFALPASAKPWQGINPGVSKRSAVTQALGQPTKAAVEKGKEVLLYTGLQGVSGTRQVQVKLDEKGVVERIDVFPAVGLSRDDIEKSYGSWCDADEPTDPCYEKKNSTKGEYWLYAQLGLAVFFSDRKVEQMVFLPGKKKAPSHEAAQEQEEE